MELLNKVIIGFAALALTLLGATLGAAAASAESACQKATGGSESSVAYTGKNGGNSSQGYTCAYEANKGKSSLKPWNTKSWTSNTPSGYYRMTDCTQTSSSDVSLTQAYASTPVGSSWTQTATNWNVSKTENWGPGIFWATDSVKSNQWTTSDCNWGDFPTNMFWQLTLSLTLDSYNQATGAPTFTISATPDGNSPAQGEVGVFEQLGTSPDPETDTVIGGGDLNNDALTVTSQRPYRSGTYNFYAAYGGSGAGESPAVQPYQLTPPQRGWLAAESATLPVTIDRGAVTKPPIPNPAPTPGPAGPSDRVLPFKVIDKTSTFPDQTRAKCADGEGPIHAEASSKRSDISDDELKWKRRAVVTNAQGLKRGSQIQLQVICRPDSARWERFGQRLGLGTRGADVIRLGKRSSTAWGGPGSDEILSQKTRSHVFGGPQRDALEVLGKNSSADGGPAADVIISGTQDPRTASGTRAGRALLIGGPGADEVVGGKGPDRINVADGNNGDRVRCRGSLNRVLADPGDSVTGSCKKVIRVGPPTAKGYG